MLPNLILKIMDLHPQGLSHASLVREVCKRGYRPLTDDLSTEVFKAVKSLIKMGYFRKNEETRVIAKEKSGSKSDLVCV